MKARSKSAKQPARRRGGPKPAALLKSEKLARRNTLIEHKDNRRIAARDWREMPVGEEGSSRRRNGATAQKLKGQGKPHRQLRVRAKSQTATAARARTSRGGPGAPKGSSATRRAPRRSLAAK